MNSPSIKEAIARATKILQAAGVPDARREAMSLLGFVLGRDRTFLITHDDEQLEKSAERRFVEVAETRASGKPRQYITGHQEFWKLDFEVTEDVLIPRPETEILVEEALTLIPSGAPFILCDVGIGSGCIAVSLLYEREDARAIGLDISSGALAVADRNAQLHHVSERLELLESDCFAAFMGRDDSFDMIVSNPPYVIEADVAGLQREVRDHEPRNALTPGGDGFGVVRRLIAESPRYLKRDGLLLIEIGFDQAEAVAGMIDCDIWSLLDIHKDLQGIPRTVVLKRN